MKLIAACIVSFLITLVTGRFLLPELRRLKAGQSIREDGPTWHAGKSGTPTMGGLMFIFGILVTILVFGWDAMRAGSFAHLYVFAFAAVFGLIGFLDDFQKVKMHRNLGLTAIQKFALQLAAAVVFLCLMRYEGMLTPNLYIPFVNTYIILNWVVYMIFAAFVIVGTVNAVNITDGIDGLAGSVTVPVALFFAVVGSWWGYENDLGVFAAAMVGGLIGFLVYNFHPAKVFMGDTGGLGDVYKRQMICRSCCCSSASSTSARRSRTSFRSPTLRRRTASAFSRWRRCTITLSSAAGARSSS